MTQSEPRDSFDGSTTTALTRTEHPDEFTTPIRPQRRPNADEFPELRAPATPTQTGHPSVFPHSNSSHTLRSHRSMPHMGPTKLPVSLVFKRTCYKCGNLGHHADECESTERLCYNCKQPGHLSSSCPNDRNTVSKQCYFCKEMGHIQSECRRYQHMRQERRYIPQPPHGNQTPPPPPPAQILYYSQMRSQMPPPPPHPGMRRALRHAPSLPHFYYPPPPQMGQYPQMQYPLPPLPQTPHAPQRQPPLPQMFYPPPMMAQGEYLPSATQHFGSQLLSMRGYPASPSKTPTACTNCGERGHESRDCRRR